MIEYGLEFLIAKPEITLFLFSKNINELFIVNPFTYNWEISVASLSKSSLGHSI